MPLKPHRHLSRLFSSSSLTVGIRAEDSARIWERRCPLPPSAVYDLIREHNVQVLVQPCARRIWSTQEFEKAGAKIHPTLSPAHVVLGIKEPPIHTLDHVLSPLPLGSSDSVPRTHMMFSHTTKGQAYNMGLLSRFLRGNDLPRLVDFELITGEDGKRTVGFGWFAGVAGVLESLSAMAHHHLTLGVASPFLYTPRPHTVPSLSDIRSSLRSIGKHISTYGTPESLGPMVVCVTGTGNVSRGALDILSELPIKKVKASDLPSLVSNTDTPLNKVYLVHATLPDYITHSSTNAPYDRASYYASPTSYKSTFQTNIAPYLTLFINGVGWSPSFPRVMSNEDLAVALKLAQGVRGKGRMQCVGDVSCDIEGGFEATTKPSTLSSPFYYSRPSTLSPDLPSIQIMAVDILPASLPKDASEHFGKVLKPYLKTLLTDYRGSVAGWSSNKEEKDKKGLKAALERATIAHKGGLYPNWTWLQQNVDDCLAQEEKQASTQVRPTKSVPSGQGRNKRVLVLGSGLVAGPAVDLLAQRPDVDVLVASNVPQPASTFPASVKTVNLDATNKQKVEDLVTESDVVLR